MKIVARFTLLLTFLLLATVKLTAGLIPTSLAVTVEKRVSPESSTHLIYIQDIHEQVGPQTNLAEIISRLDADAAAQGRKLLIAVEGASGPVDVDSLKGLSDPKNREAVAVGLLKSGYLFGEEYAALLSEPGRMKLVGVDDPVLYQKNILAWEKSRRTGVVLSDIRNLKHQLQALIDHTFNKPLAELEKKQIQFNAGQITLGAYVDALSQKNPTLVKSYSSLTAVLALHHEAQALDFEAVDREREVVLKAARKNKNPNAWARMMAEAIAFRDGHMSALEYYSALLPAMTMPCPHLHRYLAYLEKAEHTTTDLAFRDAAMVADTLAKTQIKHAVAKNLYQYLRWIDTQENFYSLNLTSTEWAEQKNSPAEENQKTLKAVREFLKEQVEDIGLTPLTQEAKAKNYQNAFENAVWFYRLAEERNTALVNNLNEVMKKETGANVVLIAGGFHTAGIIKLLKAQKMGYTVLRPQFATDVVLPEGIAYPAYVKNPGDVQDVQFLRAQGGLFAEGGLDFVRRLLLDVSRHISDRMWPKKLGSERSSVLSQRWKLMIGWTWRWVSAAIPGARLLESSGVESTYVGTTVTNVVSALGQQANMVAQQMDTLVTNAAKISDTAVLLIDIDSFGTGEFETQGTAWMRLLSALNAKAKFVGEGRAQIVFYSQSPQPKIQMLLSQKQYVVEGLIFRFVVQKNTAELNATVSQLRQKNMFHLSRKSDAVDGTTPVLVLGVPHLALATFAYAHFQDAATVLNNLVHLFENLTPLTMSGRITSQILGTLLAQLSA